MNSIAWDASDTHIGDRRSGVRSKVTERVIVNSGKPYRGGVLYDISTTGIAIEYLIEDGVIDEPLEDDEMVKLVLDGLSVFSGRVARIFEGGFAVRFDWDADLRQVIDKSTT